MGMALTGCMELAVHIPQQVAEKRSMLGEYWGRRIRRSTLTEPVESVLAGQPSCELKWFEAAVGNHARTRGSGSPRQLR